MQPPKQLKGEARKNWVRLFTPLEPKSEVEVGMALRYLDWVALYELSKAEVDANGTVTSAPNGATYSSPHYGNMLKAEDQMRRLWKELAKSMTAKPKEDKSLGDFAAL